MGSVKPRGHSSILTRTESRTVPDKQFVPSDLIYIDVKLQEACQRFGQKDGLDREKNKWTARQRKHQIDKQPKSHKWDKVRK